MANRIVEIVAKYVSRFPLVQGVPDHDFKAFINDFLDEFMADVEQLTDDDIDNTKIPKIKADNVKFDLSIVTNVLKQSLSEYLNGNPTKSSGAFSLFFDKRHKRFEGLLNIIEIPEKKNFFRIRYMDTDHNFDQRELFHVPFEKRGRINTQRFSLPGFPALYLGETIYVCWEELKRPHYHHFRAMRLRSKAPLKFIDLTPPPDITTFTKELYRYFISLPLIACCSVKVKNSGDTFKPEYIIPQLLLEWTRRASTVHGIRYRSVHVNPKIHQTAAGVDNFVLPVRESKSKGICDQLASVFETTPTFSKLGMDYSIDSVVFYRSTEADVALRNRISLESVFVQGKKFPYGYSVFGEMERFGNKLELSDIE